MRGTVFSIIMLCLLLPLSLFSETIRDSSHGDKSKVLKGCYSCHKGHGVLQTPMLPTKKYLFCYRCHGLDFLVEETIHMGDLASNANTKDIQSASDKPFRHPVEKTGYHRYDEKFPELDQSAERHAECGDCHHHHYVKSFDLFAGIKGVNPQGVEIASISFEYELCFKCHSYSANLPVDQTNKALLFDVNNPSYHPVLGPGKNNDVPSLVNILTTTSVIKCSHCHGNDDPRGSQGPHGSIYRYILKNNFTETDGDEGSLQYALCYSCHLRSNILSDQSFQFHNLHIVNVRTSCRTCHNPHGSILYPHLIDFNPSSVSISSTGRLEFRDLGNRTGECYLNCHERDHNPSQYPSTPSVPSSLNPSNLKKKR